MPVGRFMCGIAALIYHPPTATYLLLRRSSERDAGAGEWECVTGRVDQGENFEIAARREVREELSVEVTLDFIIGTTRFYRGEPKPENELLAVKYACTIDHPQAIVMSAEHSEYRWLTADAVYRLLPSSHWLYQTIQSAEIMRRLLPPELIALQRAQGFETST